MVNIIANNMPNVNMAIKKGHTNLNSVEWKWFRYDELFTIKKGKRLTKRDFIKGNTPFIGAIDSNNGYRDFIGQTSIHTGNTITVNYNGSVGETFYQPEPFWASDDVNVLYPKFNLNKYISFFIIPLIKKEQYRFNYGRKWEQKRMNKSLICLPIKDGKPYFDLMEDYVKQLPYSVLLDDTFKKEISKSISSKSYDLAIKKWEPISLPNLFEIMGTKTTKLSELAEYGEGEYPYVTTQATNNGVAGYYDYYSEDGNVLTIDSAVIGYCSYQATRFSASDHVEKLIPKFDMNKYVALFFATLINQEQYRYNYGRKAAQSRLKVTTLKVPFKNSNPDFDFMEKYVKSLPFSNSL